MAISMQIGRLGNENLALKRKFRWLFFLGDLIGPKAETDIIGNYGAICSVSARPTFEFQEKEVEHVIEKIYLPGKPSWGSISIKLYDVAYESHIYEWLKKFYNMEEGYINPAANPINLQYPKRSADLFLYNGHGETIEQWKFQGCWPSKIDWEDLDYSKSEVCMINLTLRYDRAIKKQ